MAGTPIRLGAEDLGEGIIGDNNLRTERVENVHFFVQWWGISSFGDAPFRGSVVGTGTGHLTEEMTGDVTTWAVGLKKR